MSPKADVDFVRNYGYNADLKQLFPANMPVDSSCVDSNLPTLVEAANTIGSKKVHTWLVFQIAYVNEMVGPEKKMSMPQIAALAEILETECRIFKFDEMLLYFKWVRMGKYGKFYGNVDAQVFTEALPKFRDEIIGMRVESEQKRIKEEHDREREEMEANKVTYEEYLRLKELAEKGDEEAKLKLKM